MTTVLVSMFFDLGQMRSREFYLTNSKPILTMDTPLVLFCDASTRPDLERIRGDRPTVYVERALASYDFYATLLPIVRANRETRPSPDPRNTPEYFLVSLFKIHALQIAAQRADFLCTHYIWIDIACAHVVRAIPSALAPILAAPRPRIGCCYIHYRSPSDLYPMESYLSNGGKTGIAAGLLTVEAAYVPKLYTLFQSIVYDQISRGLGHAEEQVLVYCYDRHPEWFSVYPGDYYSLATNYHGPREDHDCIRMNFIGPLRAAGREDVIRETCSQLE